MKNIILAVSSILLISSFQKVNAQTDPMKAWQDFMTPGDMHKWMEKMNGTWEAEVSEWQDAAAPPMKAKATNVQTSEIGRASCRERV